MLHSITSRNQQRRPLPSLLSDSYSYGVTILLELLSAIFVKVSAIVSELGSLYLQVLQRGAGVPGGGLPREPCYPSGDGAAPALMRPLPPTIICDSKFVTCLLSSSCGSLLRAAATAVDQQRWQSVNHACRIPILK